MDLQPAPGSNERLLRDFSRTAVGTPFATLLSQCTPIHERQKAQCTYSRFGHFITDRRASRPSSRGSSCEGAPRPLHEDDSSQTGAPAQNTFRPRGLPNHGFDRPREWRSKSDLAQSLTQSRICTMIDLQHDHGGNMQRTSGPRRRLPCLTTSSARCEVEWNRNTNDFELFHLAGSK